MLEIVSEAVKSMTEAELLQLQKARKLDIREDDYFRIIKGKTAALISACTACGARSTTNNPDTIQLMKDFGESIGIAFQIRDDLLDYEGNGLTGKTSGNDIKEKKITLPLIHALEESTLTQKRHILRIVGNKKKSRSDIAEVVRFVSEHGGMEYAALKMNQYLDKALSILDTYPESDVKNSLKEFAYYTVSREK
jgi:octaprenyl-diphosphate synthase